MSDAYFGDYLAITNLTADPLGHISSFSYMRYEEATLNIKVQFERKSVVLWSDLLIKYRLTFENGETVSNGNWQGINYSYKSDTAIASFSITLSQFFPIKSLTVWGKRSLDKTEEDVKSRTYDFPTTKILKDLTFKNNNLSTTEYSTFYQNVIMPSRFGTSSSPPEIWGTSEEQKVLMKSWHDGYLAFKPTKVTYLGEERYPTCRIGLAISSSAEPGTFMDIELCQYTPTSERYFYFKIPEILEQSDLLYPMIRYEIGDYFIDYFHTKLGTSSIKHKTTIKHEVNLSNIFAELQSIISIDEETVILNGETKKNYGILSKPTLSGSFSLRSGELPYDFNDTATFSIVTTVGQTETIEDKGEILYNKNLRTFSILKEPEFKTTKIWTYPKEDPDNQLSPEYRYDDCQLRLAAVNLFSKKIEEISFNMSFQINEKPIFFPEALQVVTSLSGTAENDLVENIDRPISYKEGEIFTQSTFILNPYEKLSYQIDSNYIYFPYLYSYGYDEDSIGCYLYEQVIMEEDEIFSFPEEATFFNYIYKNEDKIILYQPQIKDNHQYFKEYNDYTKNLITQTIKVLDDSKEIKSLVFSAFIKIGLGISWRDPRLGSSFNFSDIVELKTIRLGRTLPFQFNKEQQFLSAKKIIYSLSDYGGDKTNRKNYNTTINSLLRSGKEKIVFSLQNNEDEIAVLTIDSSLLTPQLLSGLFLENVKREIPFPSSSLKYNEKYSEENLIEMTKIVGKYYYSYNGDNEYQTLDFIILDASILEEKIPSLSIRKNGIIVNGEPEKEIETIKENDNIVGSYFVEINALNLKDRIIIKFPGNHKGEIYFDPYRDGGKIVLSGFALE